MNNKCIYCNNCGKKGHMYKDCKFPIISCGNLIYRTDNDINKILMVQRKDSLCYIEFIRGKYDIYNINYIQILIDKCTLDEKQRLIDMDYDQLWKKLWLINIIDKSNIDYNRGFEKFKKLSKGYHYNKLDEFIDLKYLLNKSKTSYDMTEWEIPKGRRNNRENDLECAIREFEEETNYTINDYNLIKNLKTFDEEFIGENSVRYKYIYHVGYLKNYEKNVITYLVFLI